MKLLKIATFGRSAFAASYTPGHSDEGPLLALMANICQVDPGCRIGFLYLEETFL